MHNFQEQCPAHSRPQSTSYSASFNIYIDLARAKSEALNNIFSLPKQNIKLYNAKRRRQRER